MKGSNLLAFSLVGNLLLTVVFFVLHQGLLAGIHAPLSATSPLANFQSAQPSQIATQPPATVVPWRLIASADYRQYIANLRAVNCPEWLIRDIIVADIDDLYRQKSRTDPVYFAPWQGADQRRQAARGRSLKLNALRQEKRALVKSLIGYEWGNYSEEVWNQDLLASLTLGFLSDDKVSQVLFLKDQYAEAAQNVREDANFILIDEDRARLQAIYEGLEMDLSRLLGASELDELHLRVQQGFLVANDIHFDGVAISQEELRELIRLSKPFKDLARSEFVPDHPLSEAAQMDEKMGFETQVKNLLGQQRFADYQRAQNFDFRETFAFSQQNNLPQTAAIAVYDSRRNAEQQSDEIQKDGSLTADERAAALVVLKAATVNTISSVLGGNYQSYLSGSGHWLEILAQPQTQTQSP